MNNSKLSRQKYDQMNTVQVKLKFNKKTDSDILKRLKEVPAKQTYIKQLIRADIAKESGESLYNPLDE